MRIRCPSFTCTPSNCAHAFHGLICRARNFIRKHIFPQCYNLGYILYLHESGDLEKNNVRIFFEKSHIFGQNRIFSHILSNIPAYFRISCWNHHFSANISSKCQKQQNYQYFINEVINRQHWFNHPLIGSSPPPDLCVLFFISMRILNLRRRLWVLILLLFTSRRNCSFKVFQW